MHRLLHEMLILTVFCCGLSGCGPTYGYYGDPGYGYAPYSYGWPIYTRGYAPDFNVHHSWEDHHLGGGHHQSFGGGGHFGGFGGGHGGGGHR
jgi:hypothetical protein